MAEKYKSDFAYDDIHCFSMSAFRHRKVEKKKKRQIHCDSSYFPHLSCPTGSSCPNLRAAQSTDESVTLKAQYTCV